MRVEDLARPVARLRRLPAPATDAGLALVFLAAVAIGRALEPVRGGPTVLLSAALTLVLAGSLVLRRRLPLTAFATGTVALCAEALLDVASPVSPYAHQLLAYSLGLYATRTRARWGPPIIVAGVLVYFADTVRAEPFPPVATLFVWVATWAVGYSTARRREEQERARQAIVRQVVAEERTRMARELHDVVAHHVSVIGVLAAAAQRQLSRDPAKAAAALASIEGSSRQAVLEMHRMLGFLREEGDDATELAPPPNLRRLDVLAAQLGAATFSVDVRVEGEQRALPTSVELAAYRVVQEALTNTVKHAGAAQAQVRVRYRPEEVEVEIVDDGLGAAVAPGKPAGHGLIGMRERVAQHGGRLTAGPRPGGGFGVRATFPLDGTR